jgi:hypothetical protein
LVERNVIRVLAALGVVALILGTPALGKAALEAVEKFVAAAKPKLN